MKRKISNRQKNRLSVLFIITVLFSLLNGCKKADNFYEKLQATPQIDNRSDYAYKPSYIIGDSIIITGKLQPLNNIKVTIGGINATIVKIDSVRQPLGNPLDRIYLLITEAMAGKAKEVKITNGAYSTVGPTVDIYTLSGPGSFDKSLKSILLRSFSDDKNTFLHCINGKGDVYYYAATTKELRHIQKDGTEALIANLSDLLNSNGLSLTDLLAGGVDPQGQHLYFSASISSGYVFGKIDIANKQLSILNQSTSIAAPFEGAIGTVKMIVSGIYPDSKGNVYLALGISDDGRGILPDAVAKYSVADGRVSYIFKKVLAYNNYPGMPGKSIGIGNTITGIRFSPDESLMYVTESSYLDFTGLIEVFDLDAGIKLNTLSGNATGNTASLNVISPFSGLHIDIGTGESPDAAFGYMPMPGKRLQVLYSQYLGQGGANTAQQYGFPKWIVIDFTEQRTYAYAPGRFDQSTNIFQPTSTLLPRSHVKDVLLNYDEAGNLYTTINGRKDLIKTQTDN